MGPTRELARFAAELRFAALPADVVEALLIYCLDSLACGFAGSALPWATIVADMVHAAGGCEEASVFARPGRTTLAQAALVNGVMVGGFESEHVGHMAHPAGTVFPAALALAERQHASGAAFLAALAAGYEIVCRIGDAQTDAVETVRGIHNPAANGPFGAAAAAGRLAGFDAEIMASALGIAGSHCGGLTEYAWDGTMTKRLHLGRAAQLGLESALLAGNGFTGPATILEGRHGYFNAYSPAPRLDLLLDGLGSEWRLRSLTIKAYPCHVTSQALVHAIQRAKHDGLEPEAVPGIHIRAGERLLQPRFLNRSPNTLLGAQYSLPFTLAVAVQRDLEDPLTFDESVLFDERIRQLAENVTWEPLTWSRILHLSERTTSVTSAATSELPQFAARDAILQLTTPRRRYLIAATSFPGSPAQPLDFAGITEKFRRYTRRYLDAEQQQAIIDSVQRLPDMDDVSSLAALIRAG